MFFISWNTLVFFQMLFYFPKLTVFVGKLQQSDERTGQKKTLMHALI